MAIDLTEYNSLIDGLMTKTKSYVLTEYTAGRIKDTEYGKIISESIGAIMANAGAMLESYYKAEITKDSKTYQVAMFEEQVNSIQKDIELKDAQILQATETTKLIKQKYTGRQH